MVKVSPSGLIDRRSLERCSTRALGLDVTAQLRLGLSFRDAVAFTNPALEAEPPLYECIAASPLAIPDVPAHRVLAHE